jgi:hypothetical protein
VTATDVVRAMVQQFNAEAARIHLLLEHIVNTAQYLCGYPLIGVTHERLKTVPAGGYQRLETSDVSAKPGRVDDGR